MIRESPERTASVSEEKTLKERFLQLEEKSQCDGQHNVSQDKKKLLEFLE